jgi:hypothetical protein
MDLGVFGPMNDMPPILSNREVRWQFESPLQAANERAKSQAFVQSMNLLKMAVDADPMAVHDFKVASAMRDALVGSGAPADWIPTEEEAAQAKEAARKEAMLAQIAQAAQVGGDAANSVGGGLAALQQVAANAKGGAGAAPGA